MNPLKPSKPHSLTVNINKRDKQKEKEKEKKIYLFVENHLIGKKQNGAETASKNLRNHKETNTKNKS